MIFLILATTFNFNTNYAPNPDKIGHLVVGATVGIVGYVYADWIDEDNSTSAKIGTGICFAVMAGYIKESGDRYADGADFLYTILGGVIGVLIADRIFEEDRIERQTDMAIRRINAICER